MTDEANIAEAELAKVIREQANVPRHEYTRPDGIYDDLEDCAICDESKWDCDRTQALLKHDAKALAAALLAAGYSKRSDVLDECDDALCEIDPDMMHGAAVLDLALEAIRSLKDKP